MAPSKKVCRKDIPRRKNEALIFEREISQKLEEFRLARSKWLASMQNDQEINLKSIEGNAPNIYRGRCACLRKIKLKTRRLRDHYKSVKPLRYFRLKQKVSEAVVQKLTSSQEKRVTEYLSEIDSSEDYLDQVYKLKEQLWDEKEKEVRNKVNEKLDAQMKEEKKKRSRKAMEKLRARRQARMMVEPCRCKSGKELTVVIKGFCLCEKGNLKKLNLGKVGDEQNKLKQSEDQPEEEWDPHLTDSLDIHKKQISRKSIYTGKEPEEPDRFFKRKRKSSKNVTFGQANYEDLAGAKTEDYKQEERMEKEQEIEREKQQKPRERRVVDEELKKEKLEQKERKERKMAEEELKNEKLEQREREEREMAEEELKNEKLEQRERKEREMAEKELKNEKLRQKERKEREMAEEELKNEKLRQKERKEREMAEEELKNEKLRQKERKEREIAEEELKNEKLEQREREEREMAEEALNKEKQKRLEREEMKTRTKKKNKPKKVEIIEKKEENGSVVTLFKNSETKESEMALTKEQFEQLKKNLL